MSHQAKQSLPTICGGLLVGTYYAPSPSQLLQPATESVLSPQWDCYYIQVVSCICLQRSHFVQVYPNTTVRDFLFTQATSACIVK